MTAPKPGDRVRVTYEGKWSGKAPETGALGYVEADMGGWLPLVPHHATVEVLASPVYVNSDTTEYRIGDVVTGGADGLSRVWIYAIPDEGDEPKWFGYYPEDSGLHGTYAGVLDSWSRTQLPERLTLLVRDGKPVPQ